MRRSPEPMPVSRARGRLARLGPVWAVLAISLLAAFLPTSAGAQTATPNEPGRLDIVAGENPCLDRGQAADLFPQAGGLAKDARFTLSGFPRAVAVDPARRRLFVAAQRPGMIDLNTGSVSSLAPDPLDGSGKAADLAVDTASGRLFYGGADLGNPRLMMVSPGSGPVRIAGDSPGVPNGHSAAPPAGVPAADAQLAGPTAIAYANNRVFIAEKGSNSGFVRMIDLSRPGNPITTIAGGGAGAPDGGRATGAKLDPAGARGLTVSEGSLYIAEGGFSSSVPARVVKVDLTATNPTISQVLSNPLKGPLDVAFDSRRNMYITDSNRVLLVEPGGSIRYVAGDGSAEDLSATDTWAQTAPLKRPSGLAFDANDNLFIAVSNRCAIARVVKPADAGTTPTTATPTTATPTTAANTNTTLPTATPPGNEAVQPGPVNTPEPGASPNVDANAGASPDPGPSTGVDFNPGGVPDPGGATGGADFRVDPDAFGHTAFDLDSFGFGDSFNFDPDSFGAGAFDLDAFGEFDPSFGGAGVDGLDGIAGVEGGDALGTGAQVLPGAAPPPGAAPVQPASGPPIAGDGSSAHQAGLGTSSGQSPRGASRYSMVAGSDDGAPVAAVALAGGALVIFTCFLVLAAAPGPAGTQVASRPRPRPRGAY